MEDNLGKVNYRGKDFQVVESSLIMPGRSEPQLGITMHTITLQCPMLTRDWKGREQECGAWIEILLEFVPSAWFCPSCHGMMVLDWQTQSQYYKLSHLNFDISSGLRFFCYMAESMRDEQRPQIQQWLEERVGNQFGPAVGFDRESNAWFNQTIGRGRVLPAQQFYSLEDLGLLHAQRGTEAAITRIAQLDQLINDQTIPSNRGQLSAEMSRVLDLYLSASSAMRATDYERAIAGYEEILSKWPAFVAPRVNLAHCYWALGDSNRALATLQAAHAFAPSDPDIHVSIGRIYERLGAKSDELAAYHEAVKDSPICIGALTCLSITYREVGSFKESLLWGMRALTCVEQVEESADQRGWQHPAKTNVLVCLAETCEAMGDSQQALRFWEHALASMPGSSPLRDRVEQARRKARQL